MRIMIYLLAVCLTFGLFGNAWADASFSKAQKDEIGKITRDYLMANPEILVELTQALQSKRVQEGITAGARDLFASPMSPSAGNPKAALTVVEFFDFQCPHCKKSDALVKEMIKENPDVHFVFKHLPIFGESSVYAASAALAAQKQNIYMPFHEALMETKGRLDKDKILEIAKKVGLDTKQLEQDMQAKSVSEEIQRNGQLAQLLGLRGTPAFVVGNYPSFGEETYGFIPGAPKSKQALQDLIDKTKRK